MWRSTSGGRFICVDPINKTYIYLNENPPLPCLSPGAFHAGIYDSVRPLLFGDHTHRCRDRIPLPHDNERS